MCLRGDVSGECASNQGSIATATVGRNEGGGGVGTVEKQRTRWAEPSEGYAGEKVRRRRQVRRCTRYSRLEAKGEGRSVKQVRKQRPRQLTTGRT